jgi:16S rRNA processing protein RimM
VSAPGGSDGELLTIAFTVRPRGLRGELVADLLSDFPERFDGLEEVTLVKPDGQQECLKIEDFWFQKDRIVLKFAGVGSIEAAQAYINCKVCVPESDAVELDTGEFYDWELEGCRVTTFEDVILGKVREVMRTGGTELLVVAREDEAGKDYLIPFAETICVEVDIENKFIKINPPEGLLDF